MNTNECDLTDLVRMAATVSEASRRGCVAKVMRIGTFKTEVFYYPLDKDNLPKGYKRLGCPEGIELAELIVARKVKEAIAMAREINKQRRADLRGRGWEWDEKRKNLLPLKQVPAFIRAVIADLPLSL